MTNQQVCLIDGTAYLFRGYYSVRPMEAPDGTPVHAVLGMANAFVRLLRERRPSHVAVAFDAGPVNFRHRIDPLYKANRGAPPDDLVPQFDLARQLSRVMGLSTFCIDDFEADDVIATLGAMARSRELDVLVVSGDKDLGQILGPGVRQYDLARDREWGAEQLPERMGARAEQVVDLLALMGDASDNIPGVHGVGPKAARVLLEHFDDLDAIYADLDGVERLPVRGAASLRAKLERDREQAHRSRELAVLRRDVPLRREGAADDQAVTIEQLGWTGPDVDALREFSERWGLGRLAERAVALAPGS